MYIWLDIYCPICLQTPNHQKNGVSIQIEMRQTRVCFILLLYVMKEERVGDI